MSDGTQEKLCELESLTREYARYSRSAGGLASVLGGLFCLASYLFGGLLPLSLAWRMALVALPILWLLARQVAARRYYQRLGHVEEQESTVDRRVHRCCAGVTVLVAVLVTIHAFPQAVRLSPGSLAYLALVWLLALAAWRWLRSALDFVVGTFLFCQAALVCAGFAYPVIGTAAAIANPPMALLALLFPLTALLLIGRGVSDHRRFRSLRARLLQFREAAGEA